jgi:hypothetical protein
MPLSIPRLTQEQVDIMFEFYDNPAKDTLCD